MWPHRQDATLRVHALSELQYVQRYFTYSSAAKWIIPSSNLEINVVCT
ncbi:hypothetical protein [Paludibacterium denitrificans]|nr:hypothetical protein [Paludibacterium denitrificans]